MLRQLLLCGVAVPFVLVAAGPVAAQNPEPLLKRIGALPGELTKAGRTDAEIADALYLATLARLPKDKERELAVKHLAAAKDRKQASLDLAWALVNTRDFLTLHGLDKNTAEALQIINQFTKEWGKEEKNEGKKDEKK